MKNQFSDSYFLSCGLFCSEFPSVFNRLQIKKKMLSQMIRNVLKQIYVILSFFVRFLVFELWSILYSTARA